MFITQFTPKKLPEHLIYKANKDTYRMFSLKTGNMLGTMRAAMCDLADNSFYKTPNPCKSLYIKLLEVRPFARRRGIGSEFIKFARNLSFRNDGDGRIHLVAYNAENPGKAPHKFYRKLGFSTTSAEENKLIDEAIRKNTPIPAILTQGSVMFLEKFKLK